MGMPTAMNVGHTATCTLQYLDQNGQPMLTPVTPDAPPVWTDTPSAAGVDTNVVSADGLTNVVTAMAPGSDTVGVTVSVGGRILTDSLLLTITAVPQVLTNVVIVAAVA